METKCCSKCKEERPINEFLKIRRVCKGCRRINDYEKYIKNKAKFEMEMETQHRKCNTCQEDKVLSLFMKCRNICRDCHNNKRKIKYNNDPILRSKIIISSVEAKRKRANEKNKRNEEEIGIGNKKCSCCFQIKQLERFRHNRLKCKDCERDDPKDKFNRVIRARIYNSLKNKSSHTIDYLGCNYEEYHEWIFDNNYNLDNRSDWHIDHVIPLSRFNLDNVKEQFIAFNWRNTTPLPSKENLSKNKKVLDTQIEQHWDKLVEYHENKNMEIPQEFIKLFQQRDQIAGTP
jgi:hypothetical protein